MLGIFALITREFPSVLLCSKLALLRQPKHDAESTQLSNKLVILSGLYYISALLNKFRQYRNHILPAAFQLQIAGAAWKVRLLIPVIRTMMRFFFFDF